MTEAYFQKIKAKALEEAEEYKIKANKKVELSKKIAISSQNKKSAVENRLKEVEREARETKEATRQKIIDYAIQEAKKTKKLCNYILKFFKWIIFIILVCFSIKYFYKDPNNDIAIIVHGITFLSIVDFIAPKMRFVDKFIAKSSENVYDNRYSKILEQQKNLNPDIFST